MQSRKHRPRHNLTIERLRYRAAERPASQPVEKAACRL